MALNVPIVSTKWQLPLVGPHIERKALAARMQAGIQRRLTLVVAGPGYGKTQLLADFARRTPVPIVWYRLDPSDEDPARFSLGLVQAIGDLPGVHALLASEAMPLRDPHAAAATLVGDLQRLAIERLAICLDDWHQIAPGSGTSHMMQSLVAYLPAHVHLFLAGRSRGDLPLERWRLQGWADEISADDLRFSTAEAAELMRTIFGLRPTDEAALTAVRQTEGWAAGLSLVGRAWRSGGPTPAGGRTPPAPGGRAALFAYLDDEVTAHLSKERRAFLTETAVLEELPAPLCDALRGASDSAEHLAALAADGLFTTRLDPVEPVYRYHALFREYLLQRLLDQGGAEALCRQHHRAAEHLLVADRAHEALPHLLAAGELEAAADQIESISRARHGTTRGGRPAEWLKQLPDALIARRPRLLLAAADVELWGGRLDVAASHLEQAAALFAARGDTEGRAEAHARLGVVYNRRGQAETARRWLESAVAESADESLRAACLVRLAVTEWMAGRLDRCEPLLSEARLLYQKAGDSLGEAWALHNLAIDIHVSQGELKRAVEYFHRVVELCAGTANQLHCICLLNLGSSLALLGHEAEGRGYLQRALAMADLLGFEAGRGYALAYLGWSDAATGGFEAAGAHIAEALAIEARVTDPELRLEALAASVLLQLRQGRVDQAQEAALRHLQGAQATQNPFYLATGWGQWLLVQVVRGDAAAAGAALREARKLMEDGPNVHTRFWADLGEAVVALAWPELVPEPGRALAELLALVAEQGYDGQFMAIGEWAERLLGEGAHRNRLPAELRRLVANAPQAAGGFAASSQRLRDAVSPGDRPAAPRLRIRLFDRFEVELDGRPVAAQAWRGQKPRELCKFLALHLDEGAGLTACLDALWPRLDHDAAQRNFRVTLHWLRQALGKAFVAYRDGRCNLDPALVGSDTADFARSIAAGDERWHAGDTEAAAAHYTRAAALYGRGLLGDEPAHDWVGAERRRLQELQLTALGRLAVIHARAGDRRQAEAAARRALELDPLREPTSRLLLRLLIASGRRSEAVQRYRSLVAQLRRELGVAPSAATRRLGDQLLGQAAGID